MPELPEVETVVRTLSPRLVGRRILSARFSSRFVVRENFGRLAARLAGKTVASVRRRGKFILIEMDGGCLSVHLGMTGKLLLDADPGPYARALFELDRGSLVYDDIRQFGRIEWSGGPAPRVAGLGPEPLETGVEQFAALLRRRKSRIKPLLLNQSFLSGLGNIYTDEILFASRIHPLAPAWRLSARRVARLHAAMTSVLEQAIGMRGSSISDYVDAEGRRGGFQNSHRVYGRAGKPCPACATPIRRIVVAQRGTHYCPRCQRA